MTTQERQITFTAMASEICARLVDPTSDPDELLGSVKRLFLDVHQQCSRFDADSSLSLANAQLNQWVDVEPYCSRAVSAAFDAYQVTGGSFDPRILSALLRSGYTKSLAFSEGNVSVDAPMEEEKRDREVRRSLARRWKPQFAGASMKIGGSPVDLGGIGKGLAVQWAIAELRDNASGALIDAGGDISAFGQSPDGGPWRIGVENPWAPSQQHVAVIEISEASVATSSIRLRNWKQAGKSVHHLIDPRTGEAGGHGLVAVTVVDTHASWAEVWSKSLFLEGRTNIAQAAHDRQLAALWIDTTGGVHSSTAMDAHLNWKKSRAAKS